MRNNPKWIYFAVRIPKETHDALKTIAGEFNVTMAHITRKALLVYLNFIVDLDTSLDTSVVEPTKEENNNE